MDFVVYLDNFIRQSSQILMLPWVSPLIMIATIVVMGLLTQKQIAEMRKIEKDKKLISVISLIYELEQNKKWVLQFIHDCKEGGHKGRMEKNMLSFSWVWNPPQLIVYKNHLGIACGNDNDLAIEIINLYSHLTSCEVIVHFIHELYVNGGMDKIVEYNGRLEEVCNKIKGSFDEPISKLKFIAQDPNLNNKYKMMPEDLSENFMYCGTGCQDPTYPTTTAGTLTIIEAKNNDQIIKKIKRGKRGHISIY